MYNDGMIVAIRQKSFCTSKGANRMSELLTVAEVANILRVDDTTVRRWVKQGALEAVTLPHVNARQAYRIKRETLNRVMGDVTPLELVKK
jgi:excisionase family DNA binding protein